MEPKLLPSHLPYPPEFKDSREARARMSSEFGSDVRFDKQIDESKRMAAIADIYQELQRYKEAGVKIPRSINFVEEADDGAFKPQSFFRPDTWFKRKIGLAAPISGDANRQPAVWLNSSYGTNYSNTLRHEAGHIADWDNIPNRPREHNELIAEVYRQMANSEPVDNDTMKKYREYVGPFIPRLLPRRK